MAKTNIFKTEWIDMVFEGRNKKYGAYQLRSENPRTTTIAVIAGAIFFTVLVAMPKIYDMVKGLAGAVEEEQVDKVIEVVEIPEPPAEVLPPPPPVVEQKQAPKSIVEEVKFKPLVAAKKEEVPDDPPKIEQFEKADPSSRNAEASPTGDVNIGTPSGDLDKGVEPSEDNGIYSSAGLQVQPEYPGGIAAFQRDVTNNFRMPEVDKDLNTKIYVSFVVEKDGSMTNIKVTRDPGYGLGKEAERALKAMKKKWAPGVQNGKNVRASYSLPIVINIRS
jgi:protein TonB